jgi:1-acyl-sn-glycerol-3-phosphate acyltransferase
VASLLPERRRDALLRVLAGTALRTLGVRLSRPPGGLSHPGPTGSLIVANHVSWLDILAVLACEPATMLAKREVSRWPVIGTLAARVGTRFLDRDRLRALPAVVAELADVLRSGRSISAFPEGTTWCGRAAGPFRNAVFQAAIDADAPVRPLTIRYLQGVRPSTIAAYIGDDPLIKSLARIIGARDLVLHIDRHPVVPASSAGVHPVAQARRQRLAAESRRAVHSELATVPADAHPVAA